MTDLPAGTATADGNAELAALYEELARTRRAARKLGGIVSAQARTFYAAWIDIARGDPDSAREWVLNPVPDVWDGEPWDGTETGGQWFRRTTSAGSATQADGGHLDCARDRITEVNEARRDERERCARLAELVSAVCLESCGDASACTHGDHTRPFARFLRDGTAPDSLTDVITKAIHKALFPHAPVASTPAREAAEAVVAVLPWSGVPAGGPGVAP